MKDEKKIIQIQIQVAKTFTDFTYISFLNESRILSDFDTSNIFNRSEIYGKFEK